MRDTPIWIYRFFLSVIKYNVLVFQSNQLINIQSVSFWFYQNTYKSSPYLPCERHLHKTQLNSQTKRVCVLILLLTLKHGFYACLEFIYHMHLGNCSTENTLFVLSTNPGTQAFASADVHKKYFVQKLVFNVTNTRNRLILKMFEDHR